MFQFLALSCVAVAVAGQGALGQVAASFGSASASSTHPAGFAAEDATTARAGYWCSSGHHAPGQHVTWTGILNAQQNAAGLSINWAYGPGEFRILTSADGGSFEEAAGWRSATRAETAYGEVVMFEKPRRVKAVTVVMRAAKPWGYFGIQDTSLLVQPGASMLVSGDGLCLVADGSAVSSKPCLDCIASGSGAEVFSLNRLSQLVAVTTGKCVSLAGGGQRLLLQDCQEAAEAGDGRSTLAVTPAEQLQFKSLGDYCLAASAAGISVAPCSEEGSVLLTAVPDFDPAVAARARDSAAMLKAAFRRQTALLAALKDRTSKGGACAGFIKANASGEVRQPGLSLSRGYSERFSEAALDASSKIDGQLGIDMALVKALISESKATLESAS